MAPSKRKGKTSTEPTSSPVKPTASDSKHTPQAGSDSERSVEISESNQATPVKVNNGSTAELKNALDDTTKLYLNHHHKFSQDHTHDDIKLSVGWLSSLIAGGLSLAGWYYGWEKTRPYTGYLVGVYCVLTVILTAYVSIVQKQIFYVGTRTGSSNTQSAPERITISSEVTAYDPIYKLTLEYEIPKKTGLKKYQTTLQPHFKQFFDVEGTLDESRWHSYLDGVLKTAASKA